MRKYKEDIQIENFPGARFQHFTDILTKDRANKKVLKFIIFYVGLNDRSSHPVKTSCRNLITMMTWVRARFPTIKTCLTEINHKFKLK